MSVPLPVRYGEGVELDNFMAVTPAHNIALPSAHSLVPSLLGVSKQCYALDHTATTIERAAVVLNEVTRLAEGLPLLQPMGGGGCAHG